MENNVVKHKYKWSSVLAVFLYVIADCFQLTRAKQKSV